MALNVLAMDGGATILSLASLRMLQCIQKSRPEFLSSIDVFAGTSAGGINVLVMTGSANREEGLENAINFWTDTPVSASAGRILLALSGIISISGNDTIKESLYQVLADQTLGDLEKKGDHLVIPTFKLKGVGSHGQPVWKPKVFHNFGDKPDLDELALDVALRTSASPVFLPIYQGFVDGGLVANNPSMIALSQVLSKVSPGDIRLLSVGTGMANTYLDVKNAPWGWSQWLGNLCRPLVLVEAFFEGGVEATNYQCRSILNEKFYRLDPHLEVDGKPLDFDLEDGYAVRESSLSQKVKERIESAVGIDACAGSPPWLREVVQWLDEVGWCEPSEGSADKEKAAPKEKAATKKKAAPRKSRRPPSSAKKPKSR